MISSVKKGLDNIVNLNENGITLVYGPAGSGKTTVVKTALLSLLKYGKKAMLIDSRNNFSAERFGQLAGPNYKNYLENIFLFKVNSFYDQHNKITEVIDFLDNINILTVDSIGHFYRKELSNDLYGTNKLMEMQIRCLNEASKQIPVIIANDVYTDLINNRITMVASNIIERWSSRIIELKNNPRIIKIHKPEIREAGFKIEEKGIFLV